MAIDLSGQTVLVTGGAGFIGSHLVDALVKKGAEVRVIDNFANSRIENLAQSMDSIEFVEGDIRDLQLCRDTCRGCRFVFHLAALGSITRSMNDPCTSISTNLMGSVHVFTAAREARVERTVYASSSNVYGNDPNLPKTEGREGEPMSPYAASKQMVEKAAAIFHRSFGQEVVGLRYFNVFGPRQSPTGPYAAVIPRFFEAGLTGAPLTIHGDGEQTRDFTPVAEALRGTLLAAEAPALAAGRAFNIAGGRRTSVNELARMVCNLIGSSSELVYTEKRPGDIEHSYADLGQSREYLDFEPQSSIEQGLERCLPFYQQLAVPAAR
ncbi:MAG: SDR family NAD(P)-dependent oxidoreductase [Thermoanaerobaculia bacterium]